MKYKLRRDGFDNHIVELWGVTKCDGFAIEITSNVVTDPKPFFFISEAHVSFRIEKDTGNDCEVVHNVIDNIRACRMFGEFVNTLDF